MICVIRDTWRIHGFPYHFAVFSETPRPSVQRNCDRSSRFTTASVILARLFAALLVSELIGWTGSREAKLTGAHLPREGTLVLAGATSWRVQDAKASRARARLLVTPLKRVSLCLIRHSGLRQAERQPWLRPSSSRRVSSRLVLSRLVSSCLVSSTDFPAKIDRTTASIPLFLSSPWLRAIEGFFFQCGILGQREKKDMHI